MSFLTIFCHSARRTATRLINLHSYIHHTGRDVFGCAQDFTVYSQYHPVHLGGDPIFARHVPDLQSDAEMGARQIHQSPRQRWSVILPCVRLPLVAL